MKEIEARLALARLTTQRRRALLEDNHISVQRVDEAASDQRALGAQLEAARAAIESVDVGLALSRLEAPYAGSITARHVDEGTVVSPGQTLLEMIEDGALEVRIGVPASVAAELSPVDAYAIEVEGRSVDAELDAVLTTVEPETRTVTAIFRLPELPRETAGVKSGALARVAIRRHVAAEGFWLPITALTESRRGLWSAYAVVPVEGEEARVASPVLRIDRREAEVLHAEAERAFVRGTLRDGERVVATGLHRLVPGQRVALEPSRVAQSPEPRS